MKKQFRIFALTLAVVVLAAGFAGCGSSASSAASVSTPVASSSAQGGKITIFQQKSEIYDQLVALAADYQKETGVQVEVWPIAGDDYYQNLKTYMSSESGPTVFSLNSKSEINEMSGYLADLSGLPVMSKIQDTLKGATNEGTVIGVPYTAEGFGIVYNESLVKPVDIDTTDKLVSFIGKSGDVTSFQLSQEDYFLIGHILNFPFAVQDDPVAFCQQVYKGEVKLADVSAFQDLAKIFDAIRQSEQSPVEVSYDDNCGNFATGKTASIHQGNWCYSLFKDYNVTFDMGITGVPVDGNTAVAVGVPSYWCVNGDASAEEQQLGKDFINWLYTSETGTHYLMDEFGFLPVVDGMKSTTLDPISQSIADSIASGNILPWTFNEEWPANIISNYLAPVAQEFFTTNMTQQEFLDKLNEAFVTAANE